MPSFRLAETEWNDDLQKVAAREMGDANRWPELVWLNGLTFPYITNVDGLVSATVLLAGSLIKVPAPTGVFTDQTERGQVYERDVALVGRKLQDDGNGDFAIVTGADNLRQQLSHRLATPRGQATRHPEYGSLHHRLLGTKNGAAATLLGADYVKAALGADYRVARVDDATVEVSGDAVRITARAVAIEGGVVDLLVNS